MCLRGVSAISLAVSHVADLAKPKTSLQANGLDDVVLYSMNFGNYRQEINPKVIGWFNKVSKHGIPGYFFTDQNITTPMTGWTVVKVQTLPELPGLTFARRTTKRLKFNGHAVLKPYRYWIHADSNVDTLKDLDQMLSHGLASFVKCDQKASLFIRRHPGRKTIQEEMKFLTPPQGGQKQGFQSEQWKAWNQFLEPWYTKINKIPLVWTSIFVLDTSDKHLMDSWASIDDVIEEHGVARDQCAYAFTMGEQLSKVNYLKINQISPVCK